MSDTKTAVVIGAGVAGMAVATRLALQGFSVQVYERNPSPGGKLTMFEKDGYRFDAGPSLFTQPQNLEKLFADAGESLQTYLSYQRLPVSCKYFFENGKVITAYDDKEKFSEEIETVAGEPAANLERYLSASRQLYDRIGHIFLNYPLNKWKTWWSKKVLHALPAIQYAYLFRSLYAYNSRQFKTPELQQVFNRFATYNGSNPFKAPAMLSLIPHLEMNQGVFYPKGGMISITHALYALALKKGVQFHFDTAVQRVIHTEGIAKGIVVNNENRYANVVVSNMDMYYTWKNLIGRTDQANRLARQERSSSALVFYWGINKRFEQLDLHNIFFSSNYREEFEHIFHKKGIYADPTIYVNITAGYDTGHAPAGRENWFVMINVPSVSGDWPAWQQELRQSVIAKLNRLLQVDMESLIESETILNPALIQDQTASFMGALYGNSSNTKMAAFKRPANSDDLRNLYCCGGTVHPGGGIPLCLKSAAITASLIAADQEKYRHRH
ncbi:MAG: phytoene desaturase family protein [Ferruginibacter sp.]